MDLSTTYLGLELKNPIIVSSSKLTSDIHVIRNCAEAGAGAIVLKSIFEEQFLADVGKLIEQDEKYFWFPEAVEFLNTHSREQGVNEYLELIRKAKESTSVPIIASINCVSPKEWPHCIKRLEEAGIDALELNISIMPFNAKFTSQEIEDDYVEIVAEVKKSTQVPLAVKLGPMFTNLIGLVQRLEDAGADGVVLFNRFFRPDIDIDQEKIITNAFLSAPEEMTQSLRWVSLLSQQVDCDIAGNTGIHTAEDVIKQILVGAAAVQICTTLYKNGVKYIGTMLADLEKWLGKHNYTALRQLQGKMANYEENIAAFERVQFMKKTLTED